MSTPAVPIQVLLVEDDPGDELMTREAFEDNKIRNTLHVVRDGEEALDFLYRANQYAEAPRPRPDPARPQPAQVRRASGPGADQVRRRPGPHPRRRPHHLLRRGGHPAQLQTARERLCDQAGRPLHQFIAAVRQIDDFFVTVVKLPKTT